MGESNVDRTHHFVGLTLETLVVSPIPDSVDRTHHFVGLTFGLVVVGYLGVGVRFGLVRNPGQFS